MTAIERYVAPCTIAEAAEILSGGGVTLLAGGTDLMPQSEAGRVAYGRVLMNIRCLPDLAEICVGPDEIRIGALTTVADLLDSTVVQRSLSVLAQAADRFASGQIRNASTIGGNICNASPAGDLLVPLLTLDARVELVAKAGAALATRIVPLAEFLAGPGRTRRAPNELLTAIRIPLPAAGSVGFFEKFGTRPALDIAVVSVGITASYAGGIVKAARIAYGAVAPTPIRGPRAEAAIIGRTLDAATISAAAAAARDEVSPITDLRASAWYRRELICNLTKRVLCHVAES